MDKMKLLLFVSALIACVVASPHLHPVAEDIEEDAQFLNLAEACDAELCQLPDCRCSSTNIPGGLNARDTPQFVLLTFDDGVNVINIETYRSILLNRLNSNGCRIGTTFFVNHEYTNYQLINELYNNNFEIALHSISHLTNTTYWSSASYEDMRREFGDQVSQMSHFANIPAEDIKGVRIPFLQMTGNSSFQVMADYDLLYDCSWPTITNLDPGLWPYTLDYASSQECMIPPCPTASIPGVWVLPMVSWLDNSGSACSMVDSCFSVPPLTNGDAWFEFIVRNFERHYMGNRSPFGFYIHEWYVSAYPGVREGLVRFLDMINAMNDVFMVNGADVIDWVRDPVPINEYVQRSCPIRTPRSCNANSCGPLSSTHNEIDYWMQVCSACPSVYPWLGNPLGTN